MRNSRENADNTQAQTVLAIDGITIDEETRDVEAEYSVLLK